MTTATPIDILNRRTAREHADAIEQHNGNVYRFLASRKDGDAFPETHIYLYRSHILPDRMPPSWSFDPMETGKHGPVLMEIDDLHKIADVLYMLNADSKREWEKERDNG